MQRFSEVIFGNNKDKYYGINNGDHSDIDNADKHDLYIPITDTTLELSVFWPSDIESRIK